MRYNRDDIYISIEKVGNAMKKIILLCCLLIAMFGFAGCGTEKTQAVSEPVKVVLDCSQFGGMNVDTLKEKMGEPKYVDEVSLILNPNQPDVAMPMTMYTYFIGDCMAEFSAFEGQIVTVVLHKDGEPWDVGEPKRIGCEESFKMFGITPSDKKKQTVDAPFLKKFTSVSKSVPCVVFSTVKDKGKSADYKFNMVRFVYVNELVRFY